MKAKPCEWRQVEEWGPEAKLVTEDVAKMFIAKKKKKFISSQPAILSLIRLTFSAHSVLAGNSARSRERFFLPALQELRVYLEKYNFILESLLKSVIL